MKTHHYEALLIRLGELMLKGKNKKIFVQCLVRNMKKATQAYTSVEYRVLHDRIFVHFASEDYEGIVDALQHVFGIYSMSPVYRVDSTLEAMKEGALYVFREVEKKALVTGAPKTFSVRTKRVNKNFEYTSEELNRQVGGFVKAEVKDYHVQLKHPNITLKMEVRSEGTYISSEDIKGKGGLPVGMGGKGLLLLSGGIDSPVAGYLMNKRGMELEAIHFATPPYTSQQSVEKVKDLARKIAPYNNGRLKLHVVEMTPLQLAIHEHMKSSYETILTRRAMMRIANRIASKERILSLVTGESLGQVASQTLQNMTSVEDASERIILRPLISFDKEDIIQIAQTIHTYETSIIPFEDACTVFLSSHPATKTEPHFLDKEEQKIAYDALIDAIVTSHTTTYVLNTEKEEDLLESIFDF